MTTIEHTATTTAPRDGMRRTAFLAGALYLVTFLASIPALALKGPAMDDPDFVLGAGSDTGVLLGGVLDLVNALACIGTAVVLFPVVKRWSEAAALGFVTTRVLEAATIFLGVIGLLAVVTLRQDLAGSTGAAAAASLDVAARSLVAVHQWTFLFGPGLMAALNALLLGSLVYRSGLVPRVIPLMGLVGAPLLVASCTATVFGLWDQVSPVALVLTLPVALWERSLGLWLVVKGFDRSA
jgi:uncharacterized protein DUF4386